MDLANLQPAEGSKHSNNFRRGRGHGSGNGKTAGKGRLPKRGFTNRNTLKIESINVSALERFDNDTEVTIDLLIETGIVKNPKDGVKILGNGELTKKLTVKVNAFSESAKAKIEELGGKAEVI